MTTTAEMQVKELTPNELNPRKISEDQLERLQVSMKEFGDIGGIVYNRTTKRLIGGHQRCKCLTEDAVVTIIKRLDKPDDFGTTAWGHITSKDGQQFQYREVSWTKEKERIAMIAANQHGGEWDHKKLAQNFMLTAEENKPEDSENVVRLLGFEQHEMESIVGKHAVKMSIQEMEEVGAETPLSAAQIAEMSSQVRMVQLFLTVETQPLFMNWIKELRFSLGKESLTDTVFAIIKGAHSDLKFLEAKREKEANGQS